MATAEEATFLFLAGILQGAIAMSTLISIVGRIILAAAGLVTGGDPERASGKAVNVGGVDAHDFAAHV